MASTILRSAGAALRRSVFVGEQRLLTRRAAAPAPALSAMEENPRRLSSASCNDGSTHKATAPSSSSDPAAEHGDMKNNELLIYSYVSKKLDNIENLLDKMEALRKERDEADARSTQLRPYKAFACVSGILAICYCAKQAVFG